MSVVDETMDKLGLRKRKKVLGLPVGPKQTNWGRAAAMGAGAGTAGTAGVAGARALRQRRSDDDGADDDQGMARTMIEKGKSAAENSRVGELVQRPKELFQQGEHAVGQINEKVSDVSEAVDEKSSTLGKAKGAIQALGNEDGDEAGDEVKQRLIIQEEIDVGVPRQVAYEQWTAFEEFDEVFRAVENVEPEDDDDDEEGEEEESSQKWQAKILFSSRQWTSEITERVPKERIAWKTEGDVDHVGTVTFHALTDTLTRIHLEMEYHPSGFVEKFGNLFLTVRHRVRKDLRLFRHHVEMLGAEERQEKGERHGDAEGEPRSDSAQSEDSASDSGQQSAGDSDAPSKESSTRSSTSKKGSSAKGSSTKSSSAKSSGSKSSGSKSSPTKSSSAKSSPTKSSSAKSSASKPRSSSSSASRSGSKSSSSSSSPNGKRSSSSGQRSKQTTSS